MDVSSTASVVLLTGLGLLALFLIRRSLRDVIRKILDAPGREIKEKRHELPAQDQETPRNLKAEHLKKKAQESIRDSAKNSARVVSRWTRKQ